MTIILKGTIAVVDPSGSELAQAANVLSSGQTADFATGAPTDGLHLTESGDAETMYQWIARFLNTPDYCFIINLAVGSRPTRWVKYTKATNTWELLGDFWNDLGHAYDSLTADETNQIPYFSRWNQEFLQYWDGSMQQLTPSPDLDNYGHSGRLDTAGITWAPNLFGSGSAGILIVTDIDISAVRLSDGAHIDIGSRNNGSNHSQGCYSASHDACFVGGGNNTNELIRIDNGNPPTMTVLGDTPFSQGSGGSDGSDQVSIHAMDGTLYGFDPQNDRYFTSSDGITWTNAGAYPFTYRVDPNAVICPITELGVFWQLSQTNNSDLWKP